MASISLQLDRFIKKVEKSVQETTKRESMRRVALLAIELIVKRTRSGKGVPPKRGRSGPNPNERKLKPLSKSYIEQRKKANLDTTTSPRKSNLTFSGRMLRSMRIKSITNQGLVEIGPSKQARKGGLTNEDIAEFVSVVRPFNNLSRKEVAKISLAIERGLSRSTRNI